MMTDTKYFTPEEAKKTLPLVRKIVKDILDTTREIKLIAEDYDGQVENNPEILKLSEDITEYMRELEEIGCYFKDWNFTIGLVDFPAIIGGKEVYLCWRSDEEEILFYHDMDSGYLNRKPIPKKYLNNN
jgi:hypothetical protein